MTYSSDLTRKETSMRTFGIALSAVAIAALASAGVTPLAAQEPVDDLLPNAACFERTAEDGTVLSIIVPYPASSGMRAKGFERQPCSQNFASAVEREAYRDGVCHLASTYREQQRVKFEELHGESPSVLCGMAEVIAGQWQFRS